MQTHVMLKRLIIEKGLKQTVIANRIGMNITTFNAILNGHAALRADTLVDVCEKGIGMPTENFFTYKFQ